MSLRYIKKQTEFVVNEYDKNFYTQINNLKQVTKTFSNDFTDPLSQN